MPTSVTAWLDDLKESLTSLRLCFLICQVCLVRRNLTALQCLGKRRNSIKNSHPNNNAYYCYYCLKRWRQNVKDARGEVKDVDGIPKAIKGSFPVCLLSILHARLSLRT